MERIRQTGNRVQDWFELIRDLSGQYHIEKSKEILLSDTFQSALKVCLSTVDQYMYLYRKKLQKYTYCTIVTEHQGRR